jgi:hypothetical protein
MSHFLPPLRILKVPWSFSTLVIFGLKAPSKMLTGDTCIYLLPPLGRSQEKKDRYCNRTVTGQLQEG